MSEPKYLCKTCIIIIGYRFGFETRETEANEIRCQNQINENVLPENEILAYKGTGDTTQKLQC